MAGCWLELLDLDGDRARSQANLIVGSPRLRCLDMPELDAALLAEALEKNL
jgi:hypothetical protein